MSEYKFYYPDGEPFDSLEQFVNYYSKMYYYWCDKTQEANIVKILGDGLTFKNKTCFQNEISTIMEWKTGQKVQNGQISTRRKDLKIEINQIVQEFPSEISIDAFKAMNVTAVGPVYKITLLFFASKGAFPIYDRFSDLALKAIRDGAVPKNTKYSYAPLPQNFEQRYNNYKSALEDLTNGTAIPISGCDDDSRRLDRSLWVYGHLFNK